MKKQEEKPIRVLHFVPSMRAAGIENFIMNLYRNIDRTKVQFDFVVHTTKKQIYDDEIKKLGGKIFYLTYKDDKNFLKYIRDLNKLFSDHPEYQIVHGNMQSMMPIYLRIAKKHNIPVRIAHAHNSNYEKSLKGFLLHILSRFAKHESTINFACSEESGKYLFGKHDFTFIPNSIDLRKFKFDKNARKKARDELKVKDNEILIGHVGRFEKQKNHKRILQIFKEIYTRNPKTKLCLIGEGKLKPKIQKLAKGLGISNSVLFLGMKKETQDYYRAMDVFMLPSLYEGLPVVGLEAQASGLQCVITDTCTQDVNLNNQTVFMKLKSSNADWASAILKQAISTKERSKSYSVLQNSNFNIDTNAKIMTQLYITLLQGDSL